MSSQTEKDKYLKAYNFIQRELDDIAQHFNIIKLSASKISLDTNALSENYNVDINGDSCIIGDQNNTTNTLGTFIAKSYADICINTQSEEHMELLYALNITKLMLNNTPNKKLKSIYFISQKGFVISSIDSVVKYFNIENFDKILFNRPYILNFESKPFLSDSSFIITGPYDDLITGENTLTFTSKVYRNGESIGYLNLDIPANMFNNKICKNCFLSNRHMNIDNISLEFEVDNITTGVFYEKEFTLTSIFINSIINNYIYISIFIVVSLLVSAQLNMSYQVKRNKRIMNISHLDELTGLLNRRGFTEQVQHLPNADYRTVTIIDIDHFKSVNDHFGHMFGDYIVN